MPLSRRAISRCCPSADGKQRSVESGHKCEPRRDGTLQTKGLSPEVQTNKSERSSTHGSHQDVAKLGSRGDVVRVAEGYGRNYLLPKKLAIEATPANRAVIEQMKAAAVRRVVREKGDAEKLAELLAGVSLSFTRKSGEHDQLFGSVTSADIARELEHKSFNIDRRK